MGVRAEAWGRSRDAGRIVMEVFARRAVEDTVQIEGPFFAVSCRCHCCAVSRMHSGGLRDTCSTNYENPTAGEGL